ncbi:MAG TPA: hypothetical protein DCS43_17060 [Verrucomicrobia bacterium]|nr:hypothetical protein [Verrucomicrobiota bacterium]
MEIKQEKKTGRRMHVLWLILIVNLVLIIGLWQYHRLIVEVSEGAAADLYRQALSPFRGKEDVNEQRQLTVALLHSEATAVSFGDGRAGYESLITLWRQLMDAEKFSYKVVQSVPVGKEAEPFNLLLLPATRCMGHEDRQAVKAFLRAGKGVFMTWAAGTQNEFGQWERYSLLNEVGGIEIAGSPPATDEHISKVMVSGGYPLTASLNPGFRLNITAFDQPLSANVREDRVLVDGVWTDPDQPTFELHSVRDRAAVVHGNYGPGRFVWMGFTISSGQNRVEQQNAFHTLLRSSMLWAGHQVLAFKPVWPEGHAGVLSVSQDVHGTEDVNPAIIEIVRKHRVSMTSFVRPDLIRRHPELVMQLLSVGEIGILGEPDEDYKGRTMDEQQHEFARAADLLQDLTGAAPLGFRMAGGQPFIDRTQDALVRAGFQYIANRELDRMVPKAVRSYRRVPLVMRPRTLWQVPEMPYMRSGHPVMDVENTMPVHLAQILALGGMYGLSFRASEQDADFPRKLDALFETAKRERVPVLTLKDVLVLWEGWDNVKIATRYVSSRRASLKISNTWFDNVDNVIVNVEMPSVQRRLDLESMTLGTELPSSMSSSGVRWRLSINRLGGGKNVVYYINQEPTRKGPESDEAKMMRPSAPPAADPW